MIATYNQLPLLSLCAMAKPDQERLRDLIQRIHAAADQAAWREIQPLLRDEVRTRIRTVLASPIGGEIDADFGLAEEAERTFWLDIWKTRNQLPADPAEFARRLAGSAFEQSRLVAQDFKTLQRRLNKCRPGILRALKEAIGQADFPSAAELAGQVRKRLWDLRGSLKEDCLSFNAQVDKVAADIGRQGVLFTKAATGDRRAMDQVFTEFLQEMLAAHRRAYPDASNSQREDALQEASLSILTNVSRALDPERIASWRAFVRTVVIRAGKKLMAKDRRYVRESDLGVEERG